MALRSQACSNLVTSCRIIFPPTWNKNTQDKLIDYKYSVYETSVWNYRITNPGQTTLYRMP